jgi:hypothetical protein
VISRRPTGEQGNGSGDSLELLAELERSTPDAVKKARAHTRLEVRCKVFAQPGDMSRRLDMKLQGVTGDISKGGCQALFPLPLHVGDIFSLSFDRSVLDIPPVLARCMRCRMIRDDAFETGLSFFVHVDLPTQLSVGAEAPIA